MNNAPMTTQHTSAVRVGLITWSLPGGGVEKFLLSLGSYLREQGFVVDIITTEAPGDWAPLFRDLGFACYHHQQRLGETRLASARRFARWLTTEGRYQAIFVNTSSLAMSVLGLLPEELAVISVLHADSPWTYRFGCANSQAWNSAVAVSPRVYRTVQSLHPDRPVLYIPNGVAMPETADIAARTSSFSPIRCLYLGRVMQEDKRVLALPDILRRARQRGVDFTLTVAGDGPDMPELRHRIERVGLSAQTSYLGMVPPTEVYPLLQASHVLLMPSSSEGMPLSFLEAQACGCIPIATHLPDITDAASVDGETALLVPVHDIDGYADALATLASDPDRWATMSRNANRFIQEHFATEVMGKQYESLLGKILAGEYSLPQHRQNGYIDLRTLYETKSYAAIGMVPFLTLVKWMYRALVPSSMKQIYRACRDRLRG